MATVSNPNFPSVLHRSQQQEQHQPSFVENSQQMQQVAAEQQELNKINQISSSGLKTYEEHFAELQKRSQAHSNDHNTSTLYSHHLPNNKMMATAQQSQPTVDVVGGSTSTPNQPNWQDDQEQFLRNLLSTSIDDTVSSASFHSQSPLQNLNNPGSVSGDEMGRYNSLSPVSSSGYQSLHDFIHNGSISGSSAGSGGGGGGFGGGLPTPPDMDTNNGITALQQSHAKSTALPAHQYEYGNLQSQPALMDAGAINFFVNTMSNQGSQQQAQNHPQSNMPANNGIPQHILAQHIAMNGKNGFAPSINMNAMLDGNTQMSLNMFAPPENQQEMQFHQGNFNDGMFDHQQQNQMLQSQSQQQQYLVDSRKRSAPTQSTSNGPLFDQQQQQHNPHQPRMNSKRARKISDEQINYQQHPQSSQPQHIIPQHQTQPKSAPSMMFGATNNGFPNASSFMPRMEVGSNATAMAAIERLKAKKRAEQEMKARAEAGIKSEEDHQNGKFGMGVMNGNGKGQMGGTGPMMKHEKKVAHNAIERRYRNNINARIAALRNAVPALRELRPKRPTRRGKEAPQEDLVDGVPAATKLNKATILGKATEYIRYLKGRETRLVSEVAGLRELIRSLEGGEELLDLWQGEMERVVAEQEALAHAAFALDDESLDIMADEDDDDDEEGDESEQKVITRSPTSSNGSSSSRYMMGLFMGFSVFGGGAEIYQNNHLTSPSSSTYSGQAHNVLRASSGRVIGASHQLLKRGMQATNVKIGNMAHEPHHFDHVPHHLLIVEVLRGVALIACLTFIFWPVIAHYLPVGDQDGGKKRRTSKSRRSTVMIKEDEASIALARKEMLSVLANPKATPHQTDRAMRKFVKAPRGAIGSTLGMINLSIRELSMRTGLMKRERRSHDEERAAIWCRLLELETSLGPLAQKSLLARLHTFANVINSSFVGLGSKSQSPLLHPARVYGTLAIFVSRASNSNSILNPLAERYWTMAKRCRLLESASSDDESSEKSEGAHDVITDRWLDPVLELSLIEAISLCPAPTKVSSFFSPQSDPTTRSAMVSPLLSIAASQHNKRLAVIWSTLLCQIAKSTCPSSGFANSSSTTNQEGEIQVRPPTCADFVKHHSGVKITLPVLSDLKDREKFTSQITRLTLTAPRCPRLQMICNVTFGTWALLLGNVSVAKNVALSIVQVKKQEEYSMELPACAKAFVKLVLEESGQGQMIEMDDDESSNERVGKDEVDALAAATLSWLSFLRNFSNHLSDEPLQGVSKDGSKIAHSTIYIRRLLASARAIRPNSINANSPTFDEQISYAIGNKENDLLNGHRDSLASTLSTVHSIGSDDEGTPTVNAADLRTNSSSSRLIAAATIQVQQRNLDDALDLLTDILSALGKRAALGGEFSKEKLLQNDENSDSGVEWNV